MEMRIRALTLFLSFTKEDDLSVIQSHLTKANQILMQVKADLEKKGFIVQTTRITTNSFESYCDSTNEQETLEKVDSIYQIATKLGIQYIHLGNTQTIEGTLLVPTIIKKYNNISICTTIHSNDNTTQPLLHACIETLTQLSQIDYGYGSFRYTISSHVQPYCPFFPGSYGETTVDSIYRIAIATENGEFFIHTLHNQPYSEESIQNCIEKEFQRIENAVIQSIHQCSSQLNLPIEYQGIDTSVNPGNTEDSSIVRIIQELRHCMGDDEYVFGEGGSLASVRLLTTWVQQCQVKKIGYCGVMLPVLEDALLTKIWKETAFSSTLLLALSSVCGVGVDTFPIINGKENCIRVQSIIEDVIALASKWNKPLSCRLFLVNQDDIDIILERIEAVFKMQS